MTRRTPCPFSLKSSTGSAIVMALLVVALIAGIAAAILSDYSHALTHLSGRHDQAQARWLARGAIDWARNVLENDFRRDGANGTDNLQEEWTIKVPPTPVEEGEVSGELEEQSGRFNINALVSGGTANPAQQIIFTRLLITLGYSTSQAQNLTLAATGWISSDETGQTETSYYRAQKTPLPPQAPLLDIQELIFVRGFTPAIVEQLRPFVTALPEEAVTINVNTAPPEVLAAYVENLSLAQAQQLVFDRTRAFYTSASNFTEKLPQSALYEEGNFTVRSTYFLATGRARWGDSVTRMNVLLRRKHARADILWEKIL